MPKFHYNAVRANGEKYEGTTEAKDRFDVYNQVRKDGNTVVSVKESKKGLSLKSYFADLNNILGTIKLAEKIAFAKNLATMVNAGLSLSRALDVMQRQIRNHKFKKVINGLNDSIKSGKTLNEAMLQYPKVFSKLFTSMVRAGEESGGLSDALLTISSQMKNSYELRRKVKGALLYPTIIIIVMIAIGVLMLIYVVPTLTSTFEDLGAELPASTQAIISASDFLANNTMTALIMLIAFISAFWFGIKTKRGGVALDYTILHIPLISTIVKEVNAARTTRALSSLLSSGVDFVSAISITEDVVQSSYYKKVLRTAGEQVQKGSPISDTFKKNENLYPVLVGEMIAVGEETGQLSKMLEDVAVFYESEVAQKTKNLSTVIEPFLMVFIGIVVGFFAVSMITPIYSISESI